MRPHVTFRLPDGTLGVAGHGDVIGRLQNAAIHLDDARISEAHALVSLRGSELVLLGLRGRFAVDNQPAERVVLTPGLTIFLARDLAIAVEELVLPATVLALRGPGLPTTVLPGVASLVRPIQLVPRYVSGAAALFWSSGSTWRYRVGDTEAPLVEGARIPIDGDVYEVVVKDLEAAAQDATRREGGLYQPLEIEALFDAVRIRREGAVILTLSGFPARIVTELAEIGLPVSWDAVADALWPDADPHQRRKRWDLALARLRRKLRQGEIRQDLVHSDGRGNVQLLLYGADACVVEPG